MKPSDRYLKWVEWSEEDGTYIGKCPDVITGIHGEDPIRLYGELCDAVAEVVAHFQKEGHPLPPARTHPMQELV